MRDSTPSTVPSLEEQRAMMETFKAKLAAAKAEANKGRGKYAAREINTTV